MCGINGIFAYAPDAPPVDRDELLASRECMRFRGPDAADAWPTRPIRMLVSYPAGGVNDLVERLVATALTDALGATVVVDPISAQR